MKKSVLFLSLLGFLAVPQKSVSAQLANFGNNMNIVDLVHNIERFVGLVFGAIAVLLFLMSGVIFLTSRGDPEKIKTAKAAVIWGTVGVGVGIVAFGIIRIVQSIITP